MRLTSILYYQLTLILAEINWLGGKIMDIIKLREDYIKLGQALKAANLVSSGVEAKIVIAEGQVKVNGVKELQRGKKLYDGDIIEFDNEQVKIKK